MLEERDDSAILTWCMRIGWWFGFVVQWFGAPKIVVDDATDLIARFGNAAYGGRDRERLAHKGHGMQPEGHGREWRRRSLGAPVVRRV